MKHVFLLISCCASSWFVLAPTACADQPTPDLKAGKAAYDRSCARCHGLDGTGDGLDAKRLFPKPRNFTLGVYKLRSTASGTPPTDDDLFRTLTNGLPGTRMPAWGQLDEAVRWQLVAYIKSLSPTFGQTKPQPVAIAPDPGPKHANLAKGQKLYNDLGCVQCHGAAGRGNGPSSATLQDDWGQPILPADLTQGWNYRGGSTPHDIALRLLTGIDGTPMPSYVDAIPGADAWQLAYYVQSLQPEPQWWDHVTALRVKELPTTAADERWRHVPRTDVRLGGLVYTDGSVVPTRINALSVQALHDGQTLTLRVTWHDRSESRATPPDRLAIAFRPELLRGDVISLQAWPAPDAPALDTLVWSANASDAREAIAFDFAGKDGAQRSSAATYEDGQWTLLLQRPLHPADVPNLVALTAKAPTPVAFVAWDGGNQETGRTRAVSYWIALQVQP